MYKMKRNVATMLRGIFKTLTKSLSIYTCDYTCMVYQEKTTQYTAQNHSIVKNTTQHNALKADFHSVQFSERAEFCHRFLRNVCCHVERISLDVADSTHIKRKRP